MNAPQAPRQEPAWPFGKGRPDVLAMLADGAEHLPIFRWRWKACRERTHAWQYVAPKPDSIEAIQLWNTGGIEVEIVTPDVMRDALEDAFLAGEQHEKFGMPNEMLYRRLGYRKCISKREFAKSRTPRAKIDRSL